jgi:heterodisulfide reductase subunit C
MLNYGYCLYPANILPEMHPEQGPIWEWEHANLEAVMERLGANYQQTGPGILRKIPQEALDEIRSIFEETGAISRFEKIEDLSRIQAMEMGMKLDESLDCEYMKHIYTESKKNHSQSS